MSKSKSASKGAKPAKPDVLTKVKDAAITKPAQSSKSKTKELAKQAVEMGKKDKKDKKSKKTKEPTPEPSESEESASSVSSSEDDESEQEVSKPAPSAKNVTTKHEKGQDSASEIEGDGSDSESDSGSETELPKKNGTNKAFDNVKTDSKLLSPADDHSDDDEGSDSDESTTDAKTTVKKVSNDGGESGDDSSDQSSGEEDNAKDATADSAASDSDDESEASDGSAEGAGAKPEQSVAKPLKRKADDDVNLMAKKGRTEAADNNKGSNLFVGNLSWNVDEAWLREVFEEYGELSGVRIITDNQSGRSKGFGYVEYVNAEDAAKAHAAKAGSDLDGRTLNVDFANARPDNGQRQDNRRKSYGDQLGEPSDTLFLGNLSFDVGQETITEAFGLSGTITGIRLPTDRETGQPRGFGYVTFASVEEAQTALNEMQGSYIAGRAVRLDFSPARPQNNDSPSRGGRGGFGGRGAPRGGRGGRGSGFGGRGDRGGRGGRGGSRGGSTNRGGFGDFSGRKTSFD